jgi:hypothetical protein
MMLSLEPASEAGPTTNPLHALLGGFVVQDSPAESNNANFCTVISECQIYEADAESV